MANEKPISDADVYRSVVPTVHTIGVADLTDALTKGIADFKAMPTHLVHFCWIYPVVVSSAPGLMRDPMCCRSPSRS